MVSFTRTTHTPTHKHTCEFVPCEALLIDIKFQCKLTIINVPFEFNIYMNITAQIIVDCYAFAIPNFRVVSNAQTLHTQRLIRGDVHTFSDD